ncbi:KAT8 regulatory NSL complex subunit 1-like protein isoform B [Alligator mississippiensis]|uniref:Long-chain specific acyl-CoA dehydrogenase, mitochondrial n=1 Tax=Alligator mississippiensis TaxID=8496 RepID=A0A151N9K6_ALLMI|nr:KAT8 regulatory NSL complex subunit 1-like protein isoform B [Alligator mississippiensis]
MAARLFRLGKALGPLPPRAPRAPARHLQTENRDVQRPETFSAKSLMDIGTRRIFTSDHDIFRESVRKFFREEVAPNHAEWEKAGQVSREVWEKAGKQGLLGISISEKHGGLGGDILSSAVVWEEQMYVNCTGPGFGLHSDIAMPYIANYGSEEQIKRFIPEMTAGKCISAIAMTEPGAGSDLQGVRTYAKKDGSDWILNGSKVFITNGWLSDLVIVVAVTNREARSAAHGISLFLVEDGMKGFIKGCKLEKIGLKAQDTAELFFEDVRLPASALLGEENKGFYYLMAELPQERLAIAGIALASCEFMFEETRSYVKQRKAFGKTIAHLQAVQHKLAELKTQICVGRSFVDSCLQLHAEKRLDSSTASMAKYWASDLQNSVATQCLQLHGGWGYMWEYPIAKAFVDSRVQTIYGVNMVLNQTLEYYFSLQCCKNCVCSIGALKGLLSRVEKDLDSDATCSSSSDEDCDEQTVKKTMEANCSSEWKWLADRARVGCRWTWLQAQISELEYKIQQLTDLHRQIRATKGMVILEECLHPKGILKKQTQLTDQEALLNTAGNSQATLKRQDSLPEHDFEMSPSSPTLLLRNIEKQSAQLSEIISSLIAPLSLSPTSSPVSSKSGKHKQLVNGISFRASDNREEISSSTWILDQQHVKKRRKERTRLRSPSVTIASMSARTRPLQRFQKRKLYRMNKGCCWNSQALLSKGASFLYNAQLPCMAPASTWSSYEQGMKSRILKHMPELDSSFHPVLSFPSDIPLHMYFEALLKKDKIKADPVDTSALGVEFQTSPSSDYNQHNASLRQWSSGYLPNSKPQAVSGTSDQVSDGRKKRHLSETAIGESNSRFEAFSFQHTGPESLNSFTAVTNVNVLSRSTPSQHNARRRLRSESSYDIDNIVIPMSLVAPSKLEKLQYKEILTPSWRVVDLQPLERPPIGKEEMEDLSDEAFTSRHTQYEEREKTRWSLWEQSRWPRRNSRSYSKNADGRHGQDPVQKENHGNSYASLHYSAEATPELISETCSSVCLVLPQTSTENQEAKSELWELRPVKVEKSVRQE